MFKNQVDTWIFRFIDSKAEYPWHHYWKRVYVMHM